MQVELFVNKGFRELELASVTQVLNSANTLEDGVRFAWRFVSDTPGFVTGEAGMIVRAEPAIHDHGFSDVMVVVGGSGAKTGDWPRRARAMQRQARTVLLLSDAATAFIRKHSGDPRKMTTHWRDIAALKEEAYHPDLTYRLMEYDGGIITAAGYGATAELIVGLIAPSLQPAQVAELGNQLLLTSIRKGDAEQPRDIAANEGLFDERITRAIRIMETNVEEPISISTLTKRIDVSSRHLERVFREVFDETPARFYKRLRVKRARVMVEETLIPLIDVAMATGFASHQSLAKAFREEFGLTPTKLRSRKKLSFLSMEDG